MSTIFKQIINLKNQFIERGSSNIGIVTAAMTKQNFTDQVGGMFKNNYTVYTVPNSKIIHFHDEQNDADFEVNMDNFAESYKTVIPFDEDGLTVGDALEQMGSSGNLYTSLGQITSKFGYTNRLKLTDIETALASSQIKDKGILLKYLSLSTNDEGYVSCQNWMNVISSFITATKGGVDDGAPDLDDSNPYKAADFGALVLQILSTALNVILMALRGVFAVIAGIIHVILQLMSTINQAIASKGKTSWDPYASNLFVAGPILSCSYSELGWFEYGDIEAHGYDDGRTGLLYTSSWTSGKADDFSGNVSTGLSTEDKSIFYSEQNGVAYFSWNGATGINDPRCNAYLYPYFDVRRIDFSKVFSWDGSTERLTLNTTYVKDPNSEYYIPINPDFSDWPHYDNDHLPQTTEDIIFSIGLGMVLRNINLWKTRFPNYPDDFSLLCPEGSSQGAQILAAAKAFSPTNYVLKVGLVGGFTGDGVYKTLTPIIVHFLKAGGTLSQAESYYSSFGAGYQQCCENLADELALYMQSYVMKFNQNPMSGYTGSETFSYATGSSGNNNVIPLWFPLAGTANFKLNWAPRYAYSNQFNFWFYKPDWTSIDYVSVEAANVLPGKFGVLLPQVVTETVLQFMATVAFALTVAAGVAAVTSYYVTRAMYAKRAIQGNKIETLKEAYLNDPDDPLKKKDYVDAVFQYNFFGKIFGYGYYDGRNGWFDTYSSDESTVMDAEYAVRDEVLNNYMTSTTADIADIFNRLDRIERLIYTPQDSDN